jgi:2-methylisocitrate lyase-like PEP mutase family enzyme
VIVDRADARQSLGLDAAIARGLAFKEAGADAVFIATPPTGSIKSQIPYLQKLKPRRKSHLRCSAGHDAA